MVGSLLAPVNKLKGQQNPKWDDESKFDASKDKTNFRKYEDACDRVKNFYREQHGAFMFDSSAEAPVIYTHNSSREADGRVQRPRAG